jgi:hypothetical protein
MNQKSNIYTTPSPINALKELSDSVSETVKKSAVVGGGERIGKVGSDNNQTEFTPFVDDGDDKKEFWKSVIVTFSIVAAISMLGLGFIISNRLNAEDSSTTLTPQYIDSNNSNSSKVPKEVFITRKPSRTPTPAKKKTSPIDKQSDQFPTGKPSSAVTQNPFGIIGKSPTPTSQYSPTPAQSPTPSLLPTVTYTPAPTPTPIIKLSTEATGNQLTYGTTVVDSGSVSQVMYIYNTGQTQFSLTSISFATTGSTNPFSIVAEDGCIVNTSLPMNVASGGSKCVKIYFTPTSTTTTSNVLQIFWNTTNIASVNVVGVAITKTPTPTATSTSTPTPTPTP